MRTFEEILHDYEIAEKDNTMKEFSKGIWGFANSDLRKKLALEANELLAEDEKLAIFLHQKLCNGNHTDGCSWHYEVAGLKHNWNGNNHKRYLKKAQDLLNVSGDVELIKSIIQCL